MLLTNTTVKPAAERATRRLKRRVGVVQENEKADDLRHRDGLDLRRFVQEDGDGGFERGQVDVALSEFGDEEFQRNGVGAFSDEGECVLCHSGPEDGDLHHPWR